MSCESAIWDCDLGNICRVSGSKCVFIIPDSKRCSEEFGEGPDVEQNKCEDCKKFYLEAGKRCCENEPLSFNGTDIVPSKYIEKDVVCCGGFKRKK